MPSRKLSRRDFAFSMAAAGVVPTQIVRIRKRRAASFFGLHFDLHPSESDTSLGRDVTDSMIDRLLSSVEPDYVQYDAKGHAGYLGWPSKVGPSAPGIVKDSLKLWREVTARRGVGLYIHFSGVWDSQAVARHPEWARLDAEGKPDERNTSTFGPYVDKLMIPQLREAVTTYDLDGAWIDGECWSVKPDYCAAAVAAWKKETGRPAPPTDEKDPMWLEWLEFNRKQFRDYVRHYINELHRSHPNFQIASNWLYSTYVPEEPTIGVDYISGDYLGNAAISRARLEARYMSQTDQPWDLMAWGFQQAQSNRVGAVHKPAAQLQQEAAVVLAQGGGFQVYYQPTRSGFFEDAHVKTMSSIARFCRERQDVSHKSQTVPQIGIIMSRDSLYRTSNKLFGGWGRLADPPNGWLDALLACQWSVDVIPDWKLERVMDKYVLLVLPDWAEPSQETLETLLRFADRGGKLIVSGAANAARLANRIGYVAKGEPKEQPAYIGGGEVLGNHRGLWLDVEPGNCTIVEKRFPSLDSVHEGVAAVVTRSWGRGEVVVVPGPTGDVYMATHAPAIRDFVRRLVQPRFKPFVTVEAPPTVEVALRYLDGVNYVHLLNTTGMQVAGDWAATDFIPEVGPIRLTFNSARVRDVRVYPGGARLKAPYTVERLHIHTVVAMV